MSDDHDRSLRSVHEEADQRRAAIENAYDSNSAAFQENVLAALTLYEQCLNIAQRISLFSPNETLEDINTVDLQYLLLDYRIAELVQRVNNGGRDRKSNLERAQTSYESYLRRLDNYDMLSKSDAVLLEQWREGPATFSTASTSDPAARRETKIRRFKEEKALKQKLEYMQRDPSAINNDDAAYRELQVTNISFCTHQSFQALESMAQELHILSLAPPPLPDNASQQPQDVRERNGLAATAYSERLDSPLSHMSAGMRGPLLSKEGKPLRPFTLTSKRQEFRDGIFRPDHSLPTMSIDQYLEEERKRGGIIDGGGPQSQVGPQVNEDDLDAADRETMKAREWDEFVEANPKGSGNTLNRG